MVNIRTRKIGSKFWRVQSFGEFKVCRGGNDRFNLSKKRSKIERQLSVRENAKLIFSSQNS